MKNQKIIENAGAKASLSLGLPLGIGAMFLFAIFSVVVTGESMFLFGWFFSNCYSTLALLITFIISLRVAGKMLARDIYEDRNKLRTTFKYSLLINFNIWPVFLLVHFITNNGFDQYFGVEIPLALAAISVLLTPFTVGQWIYKAVTKEIKNAFAQQGA